MIKNKGEFEGQNLYQAGNSTEEKKFLKDFCKNRLSLCGKVYLMNPNSIGISWEARKRFVILKKQQPLMLRRSLMLEQQQAIENQPQASVGWNRTWLDLINSSIK